MERVGWAGEDVLFYHVVAPTPTSDEVRRLAANGSFVSHCVGSDMRLGYGLTPMRELIDAGGNVCLGTTGPASNVGADMLLEAKLCLLAHRLRGDEQLWLTAREVLRLATKEGARALGRNDLGSIEPGKGADLAIFDLNRIDMAGHHDPLAALLFQGISHQTKATIVNGKVVAREGRILGFDQDEATRNANDWARRLVGATR
jgi:cytosine/adenosine deaminase-related metal-dependent hydrolase